MAEPASAAINGLGRLKSCLRRAVQRYDLVEDTKRQLRELLERYKNVLEELEQLRHTRLHDIFSEDENVKIRLQEHQNSLVATRQNLQALQSRVERSKFLTSRVRRTREIMERCKAALSSYRQFYDLSVRPALEGRAETQRERKDRKKNNEDRATGATPSAPDSYVGRTTVPPYSPLLTLNYATTETYDSELKEGILRSLEGSNRIVGVLAQRLGGVGKPCALRGLVEDKQIVQTFPGGILYIQLGKESNVSDVIIGIAKTLEDTGGVWLAWKIGVLESVEEAAKMAGHWFPEHSCQFLVDDVWVVSGITSNKLRNFGCMLKHVSLLVYTSRDTEIKEGVE